MAANFDNLLTRRYAAFAKLVPSPDSVRSKFPLVDSKLRAGYDYEYPVQTSLASGVTRQNATSGSTTLDTPAAANIEMAQVSAPNMFCSQRPGQAEVMRSMASVAESGGANAYFDAIDKAVKDCLDIHQFQLDVDYLHGAGVGAAVADDIGVAASASGTNLGTAGYKVRFTTATWSEGVWNALAGSKVDIYASNGSTPVATDVTVIGIADESINQVEFFKSGSAVTVAATNRFVFKGALGTSIYGVGALLRNTTTLFNINAASVNFWKARSYDAGGAAFTSAKLLQATARLQAAGQQKGLTGFLHPLQFNDVVAERDAMIKYNDQIKNLEIGSDKISYLTAAGPVELMRITTQKQGQAYFVSNDEVVSVGSCEPMLVGSDGSGPIVQRVSGTTAFEVQTMSSCAPLLRKPAQSLLVYNILPGGATIGA